MKFTITQGLPSNNPTVPADRRSLIKGTLAPLALRKGGDITNKQYAADNNMTSRHASKERRGY